MEVTFPSKVGFAVRLGREFKFAWGRIKFIAGGKFRVKFEW